MRVVSTDLRSIKLVSWEHLYAYINVTFAVRVSSEHGTINRHRQWLVADLGLISGNRGVSKGV